MNKKLAVLVLFGAVLSVSAQSYISVADPTQVRGQIVQKALTFQGVPYAYGGLTTSGIDCSGLIFVCFREVTGKSVPRMVKNIYKVAKPITKEQLQPGDLIFFNTVGSLTHAGIFIGVSPDGSFHDAFIHAVSSGSDTGVKITSLSSPYWKKAFSSCGRLLPPTDSIAKKSAVEPAEKDVPELNRSAMVPATETVPPNDVAHALTSVPKAATAADPKAPALKAAPKTKTAPKAVSSAPKAAANPDSGAWNEYAAAEKQRLADAAARDAAGSAAMDRDWNDRPQKKY